VSVNDYRTDGEFIEPFEAVRIIRQICRALDYIHSQGVIHRDVKPTNIMLDTRGNAILTDFGLALLTEIGTQGEIFGSPHYIAPEQVIPSAGAIPESDLYSVGIILYEMFTGQLPYDAENPINIAMLHMQGDVTPPRAIRPDLGPAVEAVILKAMAREPDERYSLGVALADAGICGSEHPHPHHCQRYLFLNESPEVEANPLPPIPAEVTPSAVPPTRPVQTPPVFAPPPALPTTSRRQTALPATVLAGAGIGIVLVCLTALAIVYVLLNSGNDNNTAGPVTTREQTAVGQQQTATLTPFTPPSTATATQMPTLTPFVFLTAPFIATEVMIPPPTSAPTMMPTPLPTWTPAPTLTPPAPQPTLTPVQPPGEPGGYTLLIAKKKSDSLFVVNQGDGAFPLAPLRLGDEQGAISGTEWGVEILEPGQCVAVWKDSGNPKLPDVKCELVGARLTRDGPRRFWKSAFKVFYGQKAEFVCRSERCPITIP
jgi:hypothetical protein